jgi:hypothetical protein
MEITRRRPFTNLWCKVYRQIVRQGHYLSGLPFSITNDTHSLSIHPGSDRRFKLFMVYFTLYNLAYVLNYIYVIVRRTQAYLKDQALCVCYTLVDLCIWCWMFAVCIRRHQMRSTINCIIEFAGVFNGMSYFHIIH